MAYGSSHSPASLRALLASLPSRAWGGLGLFTFALLSLLQVHFVALRANNSVAWAWASTLIPLWIMHGLVGLPLLLATARVILRDTEDLQSDEERDDALWITLEHLVALVFFSMLLGSEIMLVQLLDGSLVRSLFAVAGPLYAGLGTVMLYGFSLFWYNSAGCCTVASEY